MSMSRIRLVEKSENEIGTKITAAHDDARPFDTNSNAWMRVERLSYRVSKNYIDNTRESKWNEREHKSATVNKLKFCYAEWLAFNSTLIVIISII